MAAPKGNKNAEKWTNSLNNSKEFKNEKEYQLYIEENIKSFCEDVLMLGEYVSYKSNKSIEKQTFGKPKQRIDLYVIGKKETAIVELKYPKNYFCEIRNSIAQLLYYGSIAKRNNIKYDRLCLVSPVHDSRLFGMIIDYNIPIELYYLTKYNHSKIDIINE